MGLFDELWFVALFFVGLVIGSLSVWSASCLTRFVYTCHADETATIECIRLPIKDGKGLTVHEMEFSECGHTYEHVNGDYEFCPRCGRRRSDVDE